jgi:hypothetical protein
MSELHRQQQEDRDAMALTDPDDARDAQIDSLREDQEHPDADEAMHALKEARWEEEQIGMDEKYALESDKTLDSEDDIQF